MNVREVAGMFRRLTGENDQTFLGDTDVTLILQQAYAEFRDIVMSVDPLTYMTSVDITLSAQDSYSLSAGAVSILGATPTDPRMQSLISVFVLNGTELGSRLAEGHNMRDIKEGEAQYLLAGDTLYFDGPRSQTLRLFYVPAPSSTLWDTPATSTAYIDDLGEYHGLIALLAFNHYAVEDGAGSSHQQELQKRTEARLRRHLENRSGMGNFTVEDTSGY